MAREPSRRFITNVVNFASKPWNVAAREVQEILKKLMESQQEGIPGGFLDNAPNTIKAGDAADAGSEASGWMAADATFAISTATAGSVRGKSGEGTATSLARSDHSHKTYNDPYRAVIS